MGRNRIPEYLIDQVLLLYLEGRCTRCIAAELKAANNKIGRTSVSNIFRNLERKELYLRLYHAIGIRLRKDGSDIFEYTRLIRIKNYLKLNGISEDSAEVLMTEIVLACKWDCAPIKDIVDSWISFKNFFESYGNTPSEVRKKLEKKFTLLENYYNETLELAKKKAALVRQCKTIESNYRYLLSNENFPKILNEYRGIIQKLKDEVRALRRIVEEQKALIDSLNQKKDNQNIIHIDSDVTEFELKEINSITGGNLKQDDILKIGRDVIKHPSRYPFLFFPIVDESLANKGDEEGFAEDSDGSSSDEIPSYRNSEDKPPVIIDNDRVPPSEKFDP